MRRLYQRRIGLPPARDAIWWAGARGHMNQHIRIRALPLLTLLLAGTLLGCNRPPAVETAKATTSDIPKLDFEKFTLPNGLEVILSEDHRLPLVAVNLWYHVGPAYEAEGRTGFAHLFEHMMFQGSKHVPGDTHIR